MPKPDVGGVLEVEREEERRPRRPMPGSKGVTDFAEFEGVEIPHLQRDLPLFDGRVVYLGNKTNFSISLVGKVLTEHYKIGDEVKVVNTPVLEGGIECYDFASLDVLGRPIIERLVQDDDPMAARMPEIIGKPRLVVRHAEHLRWFLRAQSGGQALFKVITRSAEAPLFKEYVAIRERGEAARRAEEDDIIKNT